MGVRSYTHSFAGGLMSPAMFGHVEDVGYRTGFAPGSKNFITTPTGKAVRRPGTDYVATDDSDAERVRLMPFVYSSDASDSDSYAMVWTDESIRFMTDGAMVLYAEPVSIASFSAGADTFTTATPHGLSSNQQVRFTHEGTSFPGGVASGTIYFAIVVSTTVFQVSASAGPGAAVDLTGSEAINETRVWPQSELPREYVPSRQVTRSSSNLDAAAAHGLVTTHGDPVHFTTTGTLPSGLVAGTVYYTRYIDADTFTVYPTKADALAGTNQITLSTAGTGTHTFHYAYYRGDTVWGGSLTLASGTSSRMFWSTGDLPTALPTVSGWHQMPHDGTLELAIGFNAATLDTINYDQSFDRFAFCTVDVSPRELIRETAEFPSGSHATEDVTRWVLKPIRREPSLLPPVMGATTRNFGEYYNVSWPMGGTGPTIAGTSLPSMVAGSDVVYAEATIGGADEVTGVSGTPNFFLVSTITAGPSVVSLRLRRIGGAAEVSGPLTTQTGVLRVVGASSRNSETYVVTSVRDNGDESVAGVETTVVNNLTVPGSSNVLTWTAATSASGYRIYRRLDEVFGLIGETDALTFTDNNITPNFARTPPIYDDSLSTDYPKATCHFQQRRFFGGNTEFPQGVWGTRTGTFSTMTRHEPPQADDRIRLNVSARERSPIRHLVPVGGHLFAFTTSTEYRISGANDDTLTALSQSARPVSEVGCSIVRPLVSNSTVLFVGDADQHVYALLPQQSNAVPPDDLSVRATSLFDGYTIVESGQQKSPYPIDWYLRSDGVLIAITFMPGQNIAGWHLHDTQGTIESFCIVPENGEHRIYLSVLRDVDGVETRFFERMGSMRRPASLNDYQLLDCAITYDGSATFDITGLDHLEGEAVYALANGTAVGPFTVESGAIELDDPASTVHVGLRHTAVLRSLPPSMQIPAWGRGHTLNLKNVRVRVESSVRFKAGKPDGDMYPTNEIRDDELTSEVVRVQVEGEWGTDATFEIQQTDPLPLEIVSVTHDIEVA